MEKRYFGVVKIMPDEYEIGWYESRMPIVVRREIEVGTMWEAEIRHVGRAALGETPREAVKNLVRSLADCGLPGVFSRTRDMFEFFERNEGG